MPTHALDRIITDAVGLARHIRDGAELDAHLHAIYDPAVVIDEDGHTLAADAATATSAALLRLLQYHGPITETAFDHLVAEAVGVDWTAALAALIRRGEVTEARIDGATVLAPLHRRHPLLAPADTLRPQLGAGQLAAADAAGDVLDPDAPLAWAVVVGARAPVSRDGVTVDYVPADAHRCAEVRNAARAGLSGRDVDPALTATLTLDELAAALAALVHVGELDARPDTATGEMRYFRPRRELAAATRPVLG